jgi:hypothetical protein
MFIGEHGVGKTGAVKGVFEKFGVKMKYFSGSTMDPFTDLIGIPRAVDRIIGYRDDGVTPITMKVIEYVKPEGLDEWEAIFIDEFNRAHKRTRNAVMELLQFHSLNGVPVGKVRMVWIAINPEDEEGTYDVEKMDPAQADRFDYIIEVPYKPCLAFFADKYGQQGVAAVEWWNHQNDDAKKAVSPRRLEKAIRVYNMKGDLRWVLGKVSIGSLAADLREGPTLDQLTLIHKNNDVEAARRLIEDPDSYEECLSHIQRSGKGISFWMQHATPEQCVIAMSRHPKMADYFVAGMDNADTPVFRRAIQAAMSGADDTLKQSLKGLAIKHGKILPEVKAPA